MNSNPLMLNPKKNEVQLQASQPDGYLAVPSFVKDGYQHIILSKRGVLILTMQSHERSY